MKQAVLLLLILSVFICSAEQNKVPYVDSDVEIDGVLDEPIWQQALPINLQYEVYPANNSLTDIKTSAYLVDTGNALLVGFEAFDSNPEKIRAFLRDRDSAYGDDMVGVILDTYNDQRRALQFFVNPLGVQIDSILNSNGDEDDSWDAIWGSAGKITENGYVVEIRIPYNELQMLAHQGEKTWGITFFRAQPREVRRQFQNVINDRNNNCYLCQSERFSGFLNADRGQDIEITPTITVISQQMRDAEATVYQPTETDVEPGLDINWGIHSNLTLSATLNPDFSQIEADSAQLSENQTFSLFFPEKRPFFLENSDFFQTPVRLIYTRNIADPDYGIRLVGKSDKNAYGFFYADDTLTNLLIPGVLGSRFTSMNRDSENLVARYRRDFGESSTIGAAITHRSADEYMNRVVSIDGQYRISETNTLRFQYADSTTEYPVFLADDFGQPDHRFDGDFYFLVYNHRGENWRFNLSHENTEDGFRADSGFFRQVGIEKSVIGGGYQWYGEDADWWSRINVYSDWDITHDQQGRVMEKEFEGNLNMNGPMQSFFIIGGGVRERFWNEQIFDENYVFFEAEFQPRSGLDLGIDISGGDSVDFANSILADRFRVSAYVTANIGKHFSLDADHSYTRLKRDGGNVFTANQSDIRLSYQFSLRQRLKLALIRTHLRRDAELYINSQSVLESEESISSQLIYSYKVNPRTLVYLGYSDRGGNDDNIESFTRTNRTFFAKFSYAWKY